MYNPVSIIIMLNDIKTTKNLIELAKKKESQNSVLFMGLLPYLALEVDGALEQLANTGISLNEFEINEKHKELLNKVRTKAKLYKEENQENLSSITAIKNEQYEKYTKELKVQTFEGFNCFVDFGTYSYHDHFIGNSFLYKEYFDTILDFENEESVYEFSQAMDEFISFIEDNIAGELDYKVQTKKGIIHDVVLKDFNINKNNTLLFNNELDKESTLFLFNLLCSVNFVEFYMKDILFIKNSFYIRIKYLIYDFVSSSLESLINHSEKYTSVCSGIENYKDRIIKTGKLKDRNFRNCMRHYGIAEDDLPKEFINLAEPLLGLIEYHYKIDALAFVAELDENLIELSEMLGEWILKNPDLNNQ
ncbi:MAG: hypothetical protein ACOH15_07370 [Acetobacterium sp.]